MRPFLVTELQAGKLPRWALLLLCTLYVLPGFVGRDPWRWDDAAGFGIALTMARGDAADWLLPNVAGERVVSEGPLPFWLGAAMIRALPFLSEHAAALMAGMLVLTATFVAAWYGTYALAGRPGVQPADPFGAAASRVDFGRVIADSALLVLMATLGILMRVHETTAEAAQLMLVAVFLYGAAQALERPALGGAVAGAAIAGSVLTRGLLPAAALLVASAALPLVSRGYRLVARRWLLPLALVALAGALLWPLALASAGKAGATHLSAWLAWNRQQFAGPTVAGGLYYLRNAPWFFWPAWPMAVWAVHRWRGRLGEPALALPLITLGALAVAALLGSATPESQLLPMAIPFAMLAAAGLPTLKRSVVSLVDWFSVMVFSVITLGVWAYWGALLLGFPPKMAQSASRFAPGFAPASVPLDLLLGGLATLAWLALVRWRVSRQPPMIWRAVVLSGAGLVLTWFLLMTLWLAAFDQRRTYRDVAQQASRVLPADYACVATRNLGVSQRASLYYFARMRFGEDDGHCDWLLVQDVDRAARSPARALPGWTLRWEGSRRRDPTERLRLYQKND